MKKSGFSVSDLVWGIIILFPIISFVVMCWHSSFTFNEIFVDTSRMMWQTYFEKFYVGQIGDRLNAVFTAMGWNVPRYCNAYVSYIIFCYFLRLFFSVLMFLPKFCVSFIERKSNKL